MVEEAAIPAPTSFEEPYEVTLLERRTPTIVELELRPLGEILEYLPGEYVLLEDDLHELPPRSYSVANAPRPDGLISLLVTCVADGETSRWVHERLHVGETVRLSGPYGTFVDHPASTRSALFLAAGSGLAPIRALLEAELQSGTADLHQDRGSRHHRPAVRRTHLEGGPHRRGVRSAGRGDGGAGPGTVAARGR